MRILGLYSFKDGEKIVKEKYSHEWEQIQKVIESVDADKHILKESKEKTMPGKMLYSPLHLNKSFKKEFGLFGWSNFKMFCKYPKRFYTKGYAPKDTNVKPYRDMDFVKNRLGVEVQFGKYAFMVYNVCAKMTIFHNLNVIDAGVEIVPIKELATRMSTGVSYFEQFVWDLQKRGESNIDIPVLIVGIGR